MDAVDHGARKHALLSASSASRWLACTPSARLEDKFMQSNKEKPNVFADEGTLAHEIADLILKRYAKQITPKVYEAEAAKLKKNPLFYKEMMGEVEQYVELVVETYGAAKHEDPAALLFIEERLDFSHLVEQGFGTGDACIISNGVLEVIDLKFGKGVKVDADNNPQLMLYGAGALAAYDFLYDIHTVRLTIVQPRLDHVSTWDISVQDLEAWGQKVVRPQAAKAYAGKGKQVAGDHCKFCKVKAMCATLASVNVKLAQHEFKDPHYLTDQQIVDVFKQIPMLVDWANAVGDHLLQQALQGKKVHGYKVVEGRSNRRWVDEEQVETVLKDHSFLEESEYTVKKLAGIPAIEKLLGKKEFTETLGKLVEQPTGKPTLVPDTDKRPAFDRTADAVKYLLDNSED